jgi:hypothetical protein
MNPSHRGDKKHKKERIQNFFSTEGKMTLIPSIMEDEHIGEEKDGTVLNPLGIRTSKEDVTKKE